MYTTLARISLGLCWVAITTGIVIWFVIRWPTKHFRVLKNWFVFAYSCVPDRLGIFAVVVLSSRGNPNYPKNEPFWARMRTKNNKFNARIDVALEIRIQATLGGKWDALTTSPSSDSPRSMTPSLYGRLHCLAIPKRDLSIKKTIPNIEI